MNKIILCMALGMLISGKALGDRETELNKALMSCSEDKVGYMQALVDTLNKNERDEIYNATRDSFLCSSALLLSKTDTKKGIKLLVDTREVLIQGYGDYMGQAITTIFSGNLSMWYEKTDSNKKKSIIEACQKL